MVPLLTAVCASHCFSPKNLGEGWMDGWMKREDRVRMEDEQ